MSSILYNIHRYVYMHAWICIISSWLCLTIVSFARAAWGYVKARGLDIMTIFENYKKAGQAPYGHVLVRSFWRVTRQIISSIPKLQLFFDLTTPWPADRGHGWYQCESVGHQWPCNTVQGILRYSFWSDDSGSPGEGDGHEPCLFFNDFFILVVGLQYISWYVIWREGD